jgi:hypothetical protein
MPAIWAKNRSWRDVCLRRGATTSFRWHTGIRLGYDRDVHEFSAAIRRSDERFPRAPSAR